MLRWHLQLGIIVIPKPVTPSRMTENVDVIDFELSGEEMAAIEGWTAAGGSGPTPRPM